MNNLTWLSIVLVCLLTLGCETDAQKECRRQKDATTVRSTYYLDTIVHDEHLFIISQSGYFVHHIDCPCTKNKNSVPSEPKLEPPRIIFDVITGTR